MAKNLDVNIDAGSFLESFRPKMPPPSAVKESKTDAKDDRSAAREKQQEPRPARQLSSQTENEYLERFIKTSRTPARSGKMVYVRKEYHDRIMRILHVIGKGGLSISGYIDHVLTWHFSEYEEAIRKLYKKNYEDVY